MSKVLVTGGAGFIGSHIVDALILHGHEVTVFDNLEPQVHGNTNQPPSYLSQAAHFIHGDVRDRERLAHAMSGMDVVYHEAAAVGVGQSMYEIAKYTEYNSLGGAILLDIVVNEPAVRQSIKKLIVASSMSIYGEGLYECPQHGKVAPSLRPPEQLEQSIWELLCPSCGQQMIPIGTPESKSLEPTSIYAVTKRDHEEMFLAVGRSYGIPTVALRYFNVYGPRQALSNPYTGVAAIFSGRLLNGNPPVVYEDGEQSRDFVHVTDIAQANLLAMEQAGADYEVVNVGTGRSLSILNVAQLLIERLQPQSNIQPVIEKKFRRGDIRHCFADISKIKRLLGYHPKVEFENGLEELVSWVRQQTAIDRFDQAKYELERRGLTG